MLRLKCLQYDIIILLSFQFNPYDYRDDVESKILPDSLRDDESLLSELYSNQVLNVTRFYY